MPSANETTLSQSTAATPDDPTAANNDGQASDTNHQIICHTVQNAGSRLSRHATRVCKTREQWEIEQQRNQEIMHRIGATPGQRG